MSYARIASRLLAVIGILIAPAFGAAQDMAVRAVTIVVVQDGTDARAAYEFVGKDAILIGRDRTNHIRLSSEFVSRSHAKITCLDGRTCLLTDLRSTNGTTLNGAAVPYGRNPVLNSGDVIGVADYDLSIVIERGGTSQ